MGIPLETNIHAVWAALQTSGKGTPATAPLSAATGKRLRLVTGDPAAVNRDDGNEPFNDLDQFGDAQDFINSVIGTGAGGFQATPDELAWVCNFFNCQESVASVTGPPAKKAHTSVPSTSRKYATLWKKVGASVVERLKFNDCVASQLVLEAGTGQRVLRMTPSIVSLDPGEKFTTDPTLAMPSVDAFVYTEAAGAISLNGGVVRGVTQYTLTVNKNLEPVYTDDIRPYELQPGTPTIAVSCAMVLDQAAFDLANFLLYGTTTPPAGTKPVAFIGNLGAFSVVHTQKDKLGVATGNIAQFDVPGVRWSPPDTVAVPNVGGGGGTLTLTGASRAVAGQPKWRSIVTTDQDVFTN
jgi:hypothetical protein